MIIPYIILVLALIVGGYLLVRWFMGAEPRKVISALRWTLAILGLGIIIFVLVAGRYGLILGALPFLLPLLLRSRALWQRIKSMRGPSAGQSSQVNTRFIRMTLDHDSGEMDGEILEGAFQGASLSQMSLAQLLDLWREVRAQDGQSTAVLEAYLDRVHGAEWRDPGETGEAGGESPHQGPGKAAMTREEAYEVLGLRPGAGRNEIVEAHRKLMQKMHPDRGGSNYLASKINAAKDLLLKG